MATQPPDQDIHPAPGGGIDIAPPAPPDEPPEAPPVEDPGSWIPTPGLPGGHDFPEPPTGPAILS
jgi:hypothetical protein